MFYTDLFTPETWGAFQKNGADISGFRIRQKRTADRVEPGDVFVCYLVRLSRWCGVLRVTSRCYLDSSPIFGDPDPYVVRFKVEPIVLLDLAQSIPIEDDSIWPRLSLTKELAKKSFGWAQTANLRSSLRLLSDADGNLLTKRLLDQKTAAQAFPLSVQDQKRLKLQTAIRAADRTVVVSVPDEAESSEEKAEQEETASDKARESHKMQAALANVGIQMGFRIWLPRADRQRVSELIPDFDAEHFLEELPLNYDDVTLKTIEQIDVIWLKGRSVLRAFEVEHSTAVYSGLLRMADLIALQPNMDIALHIVAPEERRDKVLREITRPVFSLLERKPLYERCSYLSYEAVLEIAGLKHLDRMKDAILDDYAELAEDE